MMCSCKVESSSSWDTRHAKSGLHVVSRDVKTSSILAFHYIEMKLKQYIKKPIVYNSGRIQALSSKRCGWYAMDYIKKRERNVEPEDIIIHYIPNGSIKNDSILMKYLA